MIIHLTFYRQTGTCSDRNPGCVVHVPQWYWRNSSRNILLCEALPPKSQSMFSVGTRAHTNHRQQGCVLSSVQTSAQTATQLGLVSTEGAEVYQAELTTSWLQPRWRLVAASFCLTAVWVSFWAPQWTSRGQTGGESVSIVFIWGHATRKSVDDQISDQLIGVNTVFLHSQLIN